MLCFRPKSISLPTAFDVGRRKAKAMLILFSARLANEKSAKALHYLSSNALEDCTVHLLTKSTVHVDDALRQFE
jgi:hypothetical protein